MRVQPFGSDGSGREAVLVTLENGNGMRAVLTNYGARLVSVFCPDRAGRLTDVCLGFGSLEEYRARNGYTGATIGRWANRIAGASFELNGKTWFLNANEGRNILHGGKDGFHSKFWDYSVLSNTSAVFSCVSYDGEEGFPGRLETKVTFTLNEENGLEIDYEAESAQDTVINLTNHAYFNLAGSGTIHDHLLHVNSERVLDAGSGLIPTGAFLPVEGTPYDLRSPRRIGDCLKMRGVSGMFDAAKGFDVDYILPGEGLREVAVLSDPESGRQLRVITDQPGIQIYSGQGLSGKSISHGPLQPYSGVALETQHHPDSVHHPHLPSTILQAGEVFRSRTVYAFEVKQTAAGRSSD